MPALPDYIQQKKTLTRALIRAGLALWTLYLLYTTASMIIQTILYALHGGSVLGAEAVLVTVLIHGGGIATVFLLHERTLRWMWPSPKPGCPECDYPIVPNAKVCPECGKPLPA